MLGSQDHCFMQHNCKHQDCQQLSILAVNVLHIWHAFISSPATAGLYVNVNWLGKSQSASRACRRSSVLCLLDALYVRRRFQSQCRLPVVPMKAGPTPRQLQPALELQAFRYACMPVWMLSCISPVCIAVGNAHMAALIRLACNCMLTFRQVGAALLSKHIC